MSVKMTKHIVMMAAVGAMASAQWVNYPTAGIPRGADGKPNLSAPAPKLADGKPDLSGVWMADGQTYFFDLAAGLKPEDVPMLPWAQELQKKRIDNDHGDDPLSRCLPHGWHMQMTEEFAGAVTVSTPIFALAAGREEHDAGQHPGDAKDAGQATAA